MESLHQAILAKGAPPETKNEVGFLEILLAENLNGLFRDQLFRLKPIVLEFEKEVASYVLCRKYEVGSPYEEDQSNSQYFFDKANIPYNLASGHINTMFELIIPCEIATKIAQMDRFELVPLMNELNEYLNRIQNSYSSMLNAAHIKEI